ncbi:MAG: hypothetical protein KDA60_16035 [Planctomycetales bacterium]|nr:hypothetical protein [Planctomycetales bacterium]
MVSVEDIKYALEKRIGLPPGDLDAVSLREAGCMDRVCVLPENINERLSYLADVLVQAVTRQPKDDQLRFVVGRLCQSLSYVMNSASWRDGVLHDFDRAEVERKLGRLTNRGEDR